MRVISELGMQELLKRASTSVQETAFVDKDFVQNRNQYLTGLSEPTQGKDQKEVEKTRKIKFYVDNVFERTANVASIDAYGGMHGFIQTVMENLKVMLWQDWRGGMEQF